MNPPPPPVTLTFSALVSAHHLHFPSSLWNRGIIQRQQNIISICGTNTGVPTGCRIQALLIYTYSEPFHFTASFMQRIIPQMEKGKWNPFLHVAVPDSVCQCRNKSFNSTQKATNLNQAAAQQSTLFSSSSSGSFMYHFRSGQWRVHLPLIY